MKGHLLDVDYIESEGKPSIRLFLSGGAIATLNHVRPYFLVIPKEKASAAKLAIEKKMKSHKELTFDKAEIVKMKFNGLETELIKVYCKIPTDITKTRDVIKHEIKSQVEGTLEYAINFYKKFLMDNDLDGAGKIEIEETKIRKIDSNDPDFKNLSFHVESYEENGKPRISMISIVTEKKKYILCYQKNSYKNAIVLKDESEMLSEFVKIINEENPDIILSYQGDQIGFDLIDRRASELKIKLDLGRDGSNLKFERRAQFSTAKIKGRVHLDIYSFVVNTIGRELQIETMGLDTVAAEVLSDEKIESMFEDMLESWRKNHDTSKLAEYAEKSAAVILKLGEALLPQIYALSNLVGQTIFDISRMHYGQMGEWFLMRRAVKEGSIIPNPPTWDMIGKRRETGSYEGAYVMDPIAGVHENLAVLDFRSLYPSIIGTFNISPETLNHKKCKDYHEIPGLKHRFCKEVPGFVSSVIKDVITKRTEIKKKLKSATGTEKEILKNKSQAFKIVANAMYGMFAFTGARWYSKECAESASALGRHYIKSVIDEAVKEGFVVIYSDTDSIFIKSNDSSIKEKAIKFLEKTNKSLPGIMELDLQGFYTRGVFIPKGNGGTAKKRYALMDEKGNLTVRGLEKVRKDWSPIARNTQEKVLHLILGKNDTKAAVECVRKVIGDLKSGKFDVNDLVIYERLTKPLSEYKQIGPHVAAARKMKDRGLPIGEGMTIMYVITKGKGSISERSEPFENVLPHDVDTDYYITNQVLPAALRILQVLGITEEKLLVSGFERFLKKKGKKKDSND